MDCIWPDINNVNIFMACFVFTVHIWIIGCHVIMYTYIIYIIMHIHSQTYSFGINLCLVHLICTLIYYIIYLCGYTCNLHPIQICIFQSLYTHYVGSKYLCMMYPFFQSTVIGSRKYHRSYMCNCVNKINSTWQQ